MRTTDKYLFFWRDFWSQWNMSGFFEDDMYFNCAEQYMMYKKAILFGDNKTAEKILNASEPKIHQQLGREVSNYSQKIWDENKYSIVYKGNWLRFTQNPNLLAKLLSVPINISFVEASPYDAVWGIKMGENYVGVEDPKNWKGENLLGKALTEVRDDILDLFENHKKVFG